MRNSLTMAFPKTEVSAHPRFGIDLEMLKSNVRQVISDTSDKSADTRGCLAVT